MFGLHAYCWDDKERASREVTSAYKEFQEKYTAQNRIVAGASQGGSLALELCLKGRLPDVDGFIAVIPVIRDEDLEHSMLPEGQIEGLRGCLITGDKDPFLKQTVELQKKLEEQGIPCQLVIKKGMGHALPEDFAKDVAEAVAFIQNKKKFDER
ncbi:hypothetical protein P6709_09085 [Jeotgalibacillus sp. ET6]|uniref:alpha/beta hydrolase n=1 Tax=Jeotgalibacillus sp. ET6 TaxID=3037260 RepID=UPI0024181EB3|nr:hypothetical protein [Jeotgalibacillus sp. ET6]MDG5471901.1 hypothetical protein [Jeotgalibacillus sp. ET6]